MSNLNSPLSITELAQLRAEANNFQIHADGVKNVTTNMLNLIEQTKSVWRGDAQNTYSTQFAGLSDDMERLYRMCSEYSEDLIQIADNYQKAEEGNQADAAALKADVEITHA